MATTISIAAAIITSFHSNHDVVVHESVISVIIIIVMPSPRSLALPLTVCRAGLSIPAGVKPVLTESRLKIERFKKYGWNPCARLNNSRHLASFNPRGGVSSSPKAPFFVLHVHTQRTRFSLNKTKRPQNDQSVTGTQALHVDVRNQGHESYPQDGCPRQPKVRIILQVTFKTRI